MKTYTFAPENAPVREHMASLVKALVKWRDHGRQRKETARTYVEEAYWKGYEQAYAQVIETIEDSNSI